MGWPLAGLGVEAGEVAVAAAGLDGPVVGVAAAVAGGEAKAVGGLGVAAGEVAGAQLADSKVRRVKQVAILFVPFIRILLSSHLARAPRSDLLRQVSAWRNTPKGPVAPTIIGSSWRKKKRRERPVSGRWSAAACLSPPVAPESCPAPRSLSAYLQGSATPRRLCHCEP